MTYIPSVIVNVPYICSLVQSSAQIHTGLQRPAQAMMPFNYYILQITFLHDVEAYQPYARVPNIYYNFIFEFKLDKLIYYFN